FSRSQGAAAAGLDASAPDLPQASGAQASVSGGPCAQSSDCPSGHTCLTDADGYPWGMCARSCRGHCPSSSEVCHPTGVCLQRCDRHTDSSCRPGYGCRIVAGFTSGDWPQVACTPKLADWSATATAVPTPCRRQLDVLGLTWRAAEPRLELPQQGSQDDRDPDLACQISDPVLLSGPIEGVELRFVTDPSPAPVLVDCPLAQAIARMASLAAASEIVTIAHVGTYNCRPIRGSPRLSQHAYGRAIDVQAFIDARGRTFSIPRHWRRDPRGRLQRRGRWLRDLAQQLHDDYVFNIVLTPDYNDAHADHLHLDLTEGRHFIRQGPREFLLGAPGEGSSQEGYRSP
ncbi:MAG: extensin family protein, partial [Myxococcota bacterium]